MGNINVQFNKETIDNDEIVNDANEISSQKHKQINSSINERPPLPLELTFEQQQIINTTHKLFHKQSQSLNYFDTNLFNNPPVQTSYSLNVQLPNNPDIAIPPIQFNYPYL